MLHAMFSKFLFSLFYESWFDFLSFFCYKIKRLHLHLSPHLPDKNKTPYILNICLIFNAAFHATEKSQRVSCVWKYSISRKRTFDMASSKNSSLLPWNLKYFWLMHLFLFQQKAGAKHSKVVAKSIMLSWSRFSMK